MKKTFKRVLALLLSVLLLVGATPISALADEVSEADAYRERVFGRYADYREGQYGFENLTSTDPFAHCAWAKKIESMNKLEKAILWATNKLLGKELDTDAYISYLTKIMAMQEKGFTATVSAQSTYTMKKSGLLQAGEIVSTTMGAVLDVGLFKKAESTLKALDAGINLVELTTQGIVNTSGMLLVTYFSEIYEQKLAFLETLRDNTDDKDLKEAANALIDTATLEFSYCIESYVKGGFADAINFKLNLDEAVDLSGFQELLGQKIANEFAPWVKNLLSKGGKIAKLAPAAASAISCAGKFVSALPCIQTGFAIGGAIMTPFVGDDVEMYREMTAMYNVGNVLSKALPGFASTADSGSGETKYDAIYKLVAAGESLSYVRLRGEYCAVESVREEKDAPKDIDSYFERASKLINASYAALAVIFPDPSEQVIVNAILEMTEEESISTCVMRPVVTLPGKSDISEKITNGPVLTQLYADAIETRNRTIGDARAYAGRYPYEYTMKLYDAYATQGALSMQFMDVFYLGGVHPLSDRFCHTFDLETGEELSIGDVLDPENPSAMEQLKSLLLTALNEFVGGTQHSDVDSRGIDSAFDGTFDANLWSFARDGFRVTFSPYMIAEYGAGYLQAVVPYSKLGGIINAKYMPEDRSNRETLGFCCAYNADYAKDGGGYTNFYGPESPFGVASDGELFDVYIGTGANYQSGALRDSTVFYASTMYADDFFWLPEFESDNPSFGYLAEFTMKTSTEPVGTVTASFIWKNSDSIDFTPVDLYE